MRRAALLLLPILLGCSSTGSITYRLDIDPTVATERGSDLSLASMRVIERRLENLGEDILEKDVAFENGAPHVSLTVSDPETLDILTKQLTQPFTLRIMEEAPEEEATITVGIHGGFRETGITEKHLLWVSASTDGGVLDRGRATLQFTEEGRKLMNEMFKKNKGKSIGLFVRNALMSKLLVESDSLKDDIIIHDIPSVEFAHVFADDVNVGLHVTFTPRS